MLAVACARFAVRAWTGRRPGLSALLTRGGMDPARALSRERAVVPSTLIMAGGAVLLFGAGVAGLEAGPGIYVAPAGLSCFVAGGALTALMTLFNRPRVLVPPPPRREPGTLSRHRARRRRRRPAG
ncbi:MAG TPA: hypothetical protein VH478_13370 [Trebonia sp.]|nr:hypothetical protein [Trebonia sp.]